MYDSLKDFWPLPIKRCPFQDEFKCVPFKDGDCNNCIYKKEYKKGDNL